mmetsp:Transcript_3591/g.11026  ORF Transcript_3591/g.11026 Transcript_3591/m.11026 type:complete len:221 (+) Transcript_3591:790-1452(+)
MSSGDWFARMRENLVVSSESRRALTKTWTIGVTPVPPASMPTSVTSSKVSAPTRHLERPRYSMLPRGPRNSTAEPTSTASHKYWLRAPPVGNFGGSGRYALTTNSTVPLTLSAVTGVYARATVFCVSLFLPYIRTCLPTGNPRTWSGDCKAKTSLYEFDVSCVFDVNFNEIFSPGTSAVVDPFVVVVVVATSSSPFSSKSESSVRTPTKYFSSNFQALTE